MAYKKIGGLFPVLCSTIFPQAGGAPVFDAINTGLSITDRIGWLLKRVEDFTLMNMAPPALTSSGDRFAYGLCVTNGIAFGNFDAIFNTPQVKWLGGLQRKIFTADTGGGFTGGPTVLDYGSQGEDDGILMVPQPLYSFALGTGPDTNLVSYFKAWFQAIQLTDADYFNLLQANQLLLG